MSHLVAAGWASRCVMLEDGRRQIADFLLSGDACDLSSLVCGTTDWISALTGVRIVLLDRSGLCSSLNRLFFIVRLLIDGP